MRRCWSYLEYEEEGVRAARAPLPEADCTHTLLEIASLAEWCFSRNSWAGMLG
jgi:hypothetical protein